MRPIIFSQKNLITKAACVLFASTMGNVALAYTAKECGLSFGTNPLPKFDIFSKTNFQHDPDGVGILSIPGGRGTSAMFVSRGKIAGADAYYLQLTDQNGRTSHLFVRPTDVKASTGREAIEKIGAYLNGAGPLWRFPTIDEAFDLVTLQKLNLTEVPFKFFTESDSESSFVFIWVSIPELGNQTQLAVFIKDRQGENISIKEGFVLPLVDENSQSLIKDENEDSLTFVLDIAQRGVHALLIHRE